MSTKLEFGANKRDRQIAAAHKAANLWMSEKIVSIWDELETILDDGLVVATPEIKFQIKKWLGKNLGLAYAMGVTNAQKPPERSIILNKDGEKF